MKKPLLGVWLLAAVACTHLNPPIVVPHEPASGDRYVRFTVRGEHGHRPANTVVNLYTDDPIQMPCELADSDRVNCKLDAKVPHGWVDPDGTLHGVGGHVVIESDGYYRSQTNFFLLGVSEQNLADIQIALTFHPLPRIFIAGKFFRLENGERWTGIEASDFNLYARYLAGEDIRPILEQRSTLGFNLLRVWTAYDIPNIGRLVPREQAGYYERLSPFLDLCARYGLYVEVTAFTGPYGATLPNDTDKVAHWNALVAVLADKTNVLLELINEFDNGPNAGVPLELMQRPPPPLLACHGSGVQDSAGLLPVWSYGCYHPASGDEWARKVAHNGMEDVADRFGVPALVNESTRYPDNASNPDRAYDAAAGAALLEAGACFHSVHGKSSELWSGVELEAARAWAAGARSVPLEFQGGGYRHRNDLENEHIIRAYSRVLPDGREFVVRIRQ